MPGKKNKIGEILIENKFITKEILDEALEYQARFGGNVTQYLINYDYIKEEDLAKCISLQFGYPYLPLRAYDIPRQIIELVTPSIAERYWLIPIDRMGNIITVVMADPLDEEATSEVERMTSCKVQPFVGILSDIIKAIERYYNVHIRDINPKREGRTPLFIYTKNYAGIEHRESVRIKANVEVHFPLQDKYRMSETKDFSRHGFLFESQNILPIGSFIVMEIDLPKDISPYPIAAVVKVVRVVPLDNDKFDIGVRTVSISKEDSDKIMRYAIGSRKGK